MENSSSRPEETSTGASEVTRVDSTADEAAAAAAPVVESDDDSAVDEEEYDEDKVKNMIIGDVASRLDSVERVTQGKIRELNMSIEELKEAISTTLGDVIGMMVSKMTEAIKLNRRLESGLKSLSIV